MLDAPGRCGSVAPTFAGTEQEAEEVSEDFAHRRPGAQKELILHNALSW